MRPGQETCPNCGSEIKMLQKMIKTEKDYAFTLSRIDEIMDAEPGTPNFDELELLSTLVEIYEEEHYPITT